MLNNHFNNAWEICSNAVTGTPQRQTNSYHTVVNSPGRISNLSSSDTLIHVLRRSVQEHLFVHPLPPQLHLSLLSPLSPPLPGEAPRFFCCVSTSQHNVSLHKAYTLLTFNALHSAISPRLHNGCYGYHISTLIGLRLRSQFGRVVWKREFLCDVVKAPGCVLCLPGVDCNCH